MELKEFIENTDYSLYQIVNNDYRGCRLMNKSDFINYYKGTAVYNQEVKNVIDNYYQCATYCEIVLK